MVVLLAFVVRVVQISRIVRKAKASHGIVSAVAVHVRSCRGRARNGTATRKEGDSRHEQYGDCTIFAELLHNIKLNEKAQKIRGLSSVCTPISKDIA